MRDHDDLPYIVIERHSAGVTPFLWGLLVGAGAALLLAPRSGAETQDEIRQGVQRVRTAAEDRVHTARSTVARARDRIEDQIGSVREQIDTVRDRIEDRTDSVRSAFDSGRARAREAMHAAADRAGQRDEMMAGDREVDVVLSEPTEEPGGGRPELG